ncbi:ferrochelatase [Micrococcoides hystricis]|uniref:Coproporphyrin III ferrochelatase n=1 Tax=Micrococcoides hystricis TaxID=1572761 RepID=A0ABV6P8B8_9MICC
MQPKHYDALLLASFGGPEGQEDVLPFLRNVTRGRGIPDERLEEVATHYRENGGVSPINAQNRALKAALEAELAERGIDMPVYWGNRNWDPYIPEILQEIYDAGHRRLLVLTTSAYSCYSSCRQYREDLGMALQSTGLEGKLEVDKIRQYFDHPGFVEPFYDGVVEGIKDVVAQLKAKDIDPNGAIEVLFATHSIPMTDAEAAGPRDLAAELKQSLGDDVNANDVYSAQHLAVAEEIFKRLDVAELGLENKPAWSLVYQSRSGAPHIPWLEPDINDAIEDLAKTGTKGVVVVPLGFVSDHMEVIWDLDTEAKETAEEQNLAFARTPTPGTDPQFVKGLVDLVCERHDVQHQSEQKAETLLGPWFDVCRPECCVKIMRDGTQRPTIGAVDSKVRSTLVKE